MYTVSFFEVVLMFQALEPLTVCINKLLLLWVWITFRDHYVLRCFNHQDESIFSFLNRHKIFQLSCSETQNSFPENDDIKISAMNFLSDSARISNTKYDIEIYFPSLAKAIKQIVMNSLGGVDYVYISFDIDFGSICPTIVWIFDFWQNIIISAGSHRTSSHRVYVIRIEILRRYSNF